jgi:hypothetical protein
LISMPWTVASANESRKADVGRVQFLILTPPARWQAIRSQRGWIRTIKPSPTLQPGVRPAAKSGAHWLPISSICCSSSSVEMLGVIDVGVAEVDEDGSDRRASATASAPRTPMPATMNEVKIRLPRM